MKKVSDEKSIRMKSVE